MPFLPRVFRGLGALCLATTPLVADQKPPPTLPSRVDKGNLIPEKRDDNNTLLMICIRNSRCQ